MKIVNFKSKRDRVREAIHEHIDELLDLNPDTPMVILKPLSETEMGFLGRVIVGNKDWWDVHQLVSLLTQAQTELVTFPQGSFFAFSLDGERMTASYDDEEGEEYE